VNARQTSVIERLLAEYAEQQEALANISDALEKTKTKLMEYLEKNSLDTVTVGDEEDITKVTIVRPTKLVFDESGLESALTKPQWSSITKRVVDKKALEDAVARGKIDISVVEQNSKEVGTKPYLKITR
jgi:hypothetical protein